MRKVVLLSVFSLFFVLACEKDALNEEIGIEFNEEQATGKDDPIVDEDVVEPN
ncbi:hypothetical protein HN014_07955 [Aquimarina sp. TRL1]|uniref:hypothetical protein n=1 Tax=Aquimarina sp. (strain TRL1) TaxID=2736252 RepID=UPI0015885A88|nr:hypothetical protein [Aquimarina sp. TRL1]QKX04851.1 hypothetical protein HN014_07955 [Aquimarina sp. TRL1]